MKFETKLRTSTGSLITTLPKTIVDLLNANKGDKVVWNCEINDKGQLNITLALKKQE